MKLSVLGLGLRLNTRSDTDLEDSASIHSGLSHKFCVIEPLGRTEK